MRETLDFLMQRAGEEEGLTTAEIDAMREPEHRYTYDLGDGVMASRTVHRGVPDEFGERGSQGGCRIEVYEKNEHPDVGEAADHSDALAANQTLKNILAGLPFGGAKADIFVPRSIADDDKAFDEKIARFVEAHRGPIKRGDGIGPDMRLLAKHMDHMAATLVGLTGDSHDRARFTGKSVTNGGVEGRDDATSYGMLAVLKLVLEAEGLSLEGQRIAIEGAGNVGSNFARLAHEAGGIVVGMSDVGLAVVAHDMSRGLVPGVDIEFAGKGIGRYDQERAYSHKNPADLHQLDADVFVFGGPSGSITAHKDNVGSVVAPRRVFGANTPEDEAAIRYDEENGYINYPDAVVNFGGVVGSYVERVSEGKAGQKEVRAEIDQRITAAVDLMLREATDPTDYLRAANRIGIRRLHARDRQLVAA